MNLKLRLERLCDSRSWVRLHFADTTTLTGRVLRIGQDYVEIESYSDLGKPGARDYSKHLVPMHLVKFLTTESASFAEAERNRLACLAEMDEDSIPSHEKL